MAIQYHSLTKLFFDKIILQYPRSVILVLLAIVTFLGFQAANFRLKASADNLVLEKDKTLRYSRLINKRYGKQDFLVLAYTPKDDLFSNETLKSLARLQNDVNSLNNVASVRSILNVPMLESSDISLKEFTKDIPTLSSSDIDRKKAKKEFSNSPIYKNLLISADLKTTALLINFKQNTKYQSLLKQRNRLRQKKSSGSLSPSGRAEMEAVLKQYQKCQDGMNEQRHQDILAIRNTMDKYGDGADLFLGGVSMIADDMITFIKNDLKLFGLGALFIIVLTMWLIFRRIRWITIPILCCIVSEICIFGLLGWFGWEATVMSSNFASLQLIMTLAITIHLIVRYREQLLRYPEASNRRLILDTVELKMKPCAYAVLTTIVGFGSLVFCDILPVITFGWMMVTALIVALLVSFLLFPSVLILLPKEKSPKKQNKTLFITSTLAGFTEFRPKTILFIAGIMGIFSLLGILKLEVENSFIDYFKEDTEIYRGMKLIDRKLGGTIPLDVVVDFEENQGQSPADNAATKQDDIFSEFEEFEQAQSKEKYWFTSEKMKRIEQGHRYLGNLSAAGKVLSLASMSETVKKLNKGNALDSLDFALLYNETPDKFKDMFIKPYVSVEHNQLRYWVRIMDSQKSLRRNELLKTIKRKLPGVMGLNNKNVHLAGMLVLYNNMLQSLFRSQIKTLGVTLVLLAAMFGLLFKSLRITILAMIVNIFPIAFVLGVMGWFGIPLDMMTITIAAIGIGIAVDDSIHYINRFKIEFEKDHNYINTMYRCHNSIGHAMLYTSLSIIIGFSILVLSNFIPIICFGLLTSLAMFIAMVADLTILPRMMMLAKVFGNDNQQKLKG